MKTAAVPLSDLARRAAAKQQELDTIMRAYQSRLEKLQNRKANLEAELQTVQSEIEAVGPIAAASVSAPAPQESNGKVTLNQLLIDIVREKGKIRIQDLAEEVVRRNFQTTSQDVPRMVGIKVAELVKKKVLARPKGKRGVVRLRGKPGRKPKAENAAQAEKPAKRKYTRRNGTAKTDEKTPRRSLRTVILEVLTGKTDPVPAKELADLVLAAGYPTKSDRFVNVIWTTLGKMTEIENVPEQGFRLK